MGCNSSKAVKTEVETVDAQGASRSGHMHHKDTSVLMCPYFAVTQDNMEAFKASSEEFYSAALESEDVLFFGAAANENGVHVRQGYRSADAMVSHLQRMEGAMSKTLESAQLERVEVHGTREQIMKVRKQTTTVDKTSMQFFETHPKMHSIRRPTEFTGQRGSDKLVSIHVTLQVSTVTELRSTETKVKCVHRRACGITGNESFFFSRCMESGLAKVVASFSSMEAGLEHLACVAAHLGKESLRGLELHGPEEELAKLGAMLDSAAEGAAEAAGRAAEVLKAAAQKAKADALQAKACAEAAAKVVARHAGDALKAAREKCAAGLQDVQKKAKEAAEQVYTEAMKVEGATEEKARALAKAAYKRAMEAVNDIRQAADHAAKAAYDAAFAAGKSAEKAMQEADAAANAAAKAAHAELKELAEDAKAALDKAKELGSEGVEAMEAELTAIKLSVEIGALELGRLLEEAAKAVRRALLALYNVVKKDSVAICQATYKAARDAEEATQEALSAACDKAKAAAYAVATTGQHVYLLAYDKALAAGKSANEAADAAAGAAEYAAGKAVDLWKSTEAQCSEALRAAEGMAAKGVQSLAGALSAAATWVLDTVNAIRKSLVKGAKKAAAMVHAGMLDFAWAVGAAVEASSDALESAAGVVGDAASRAKHHFDHTVTMIPHFQVPEGGWEDFKRSCAGFQKASAKTSDALFYGVCRNESSAVIRHGFRSSSAMLSYLRDSESVMRETFTCSTLERVEVHGTRQQLAKIRKQVGPKVFPNDSAICFEFFETDRMVKSIRRATKFSGAAGSDNLLTAHVSIKVPEDQNKSIAHKVAAVHKVARVHPGVHHFGMGECAKTGAVVLTGTFASMEASMEHLAVAAAHFGSDALRDLEMHGPSTELGKVKGLLRSGLDSIEASATSYADAVKAALATAQKRAEDETLEAKALAGAAEKAAQAAVSDAVKSAREQVASTIDDLSKQAEEVAQEAYKEAMGAEKYVEDYVKGLGAQSYRAAMQSYSEIRQAADQAATKAYERSIAAGATAEKAIEDAHRAAEAAASAVKESLADAAGAAQREFEAAEEDAKSVLEAGVVTARAAADFAGKAVEAVASPPAKEARAATLGMHESLRASSEEVVAVHFTKEAHSEERIRVVGERARAAAWSVTVTREEAYYLAVERSVMAGKGVDAAKAAGQKAADSSAKKASDVWEQAEWYAAAALDSAKGLVAEEGKAMEAIWSGGVGFALDAESAARHGLYAGATMAAEEVHEAVEDVAWAASSALESVSENMEQAHAALGERLKAWYDAFIKGEAKGLREVNEIADAGANQVERRQKICC